MKGQAYVYVVAIICLIGLISLIFGSYLYGANKFSCPKCEEKVVTGECATSTPMLTCPEVVNKECEPTTEIVYVEDTKETNKISEALEACRNSQGEERGGLTEELGQCETNLSIKEAERSYWENESGKWKKSYEGCLNN